MIIERRLSSIGSDIVSASNGPTEAHKSENHILLARKEI